MTTTTTDDKPEPKFHWVTPPHDYDHADREENRPVIVCDWPGCDWWGTAYASQFALHTTRHHDTGV